MKTFLLIAGFLLLFGVEILRVYFIMPFPGSQQNNTIDIAYWLHNNIWWLRLAGIALLVYPVVDIMKHGGKRSKLVTAALLILFAFIFFMFNFRFEADKMFYQPAIKQFSGKGNNIIDTSSLVIGVSLNNEAKAYPIELIGYHHQVRDTIGGTPVMITYCTVCRTGRVYNPTVHGRDESFRLVGMDHFNAMFEDKQTKSWWQQATGRAIAGPLKGASLSEIRSKQVSLATWLRDYPASTIMQPDTTFSKRYADLEGFDKGTIESSLEKRDSLSWQNKSWVVGVIVNEQPKAYDWNELVDKRLIQDRVKSVPLLITLESDTASFHVFNRMLDKQELSFELMATQNIMKDSNTNSEWNLQGKCIAGALMNKQLESIQAYQEFWHSWKTFHKETLK
ncbi:MAG TPA: DUF3179 domain-containing (seleno)protein [Flavitalea sp.]|nr:DUF3179 domain-containing (seleno)protein [Flavitalea sp.]